MPGWIRLTKREREVVMVLAWLDLQPAARELQMSYRTLQTHIRAIRNKCKLKTPINFWGFVLRHADVYRREVAAGWLGKK
jgi:DNA-binding NarL/FixJ family response regulator